MGSLPQVDPAFYGVRHSFLIQLLSELAPSSKALRTALAEQRDAARRETRDGLTDFISLNRALGESQKTLAWFDTLADGEARPDPFSEPDLLELLVEAQRWEDLGHSVHDPPIHVDRAWEVYSSTMSDLGARRSKRRDRQRNEYVREEFYRTVSLLIRCLRAAHRTEDAEAVRVRALDLNPSPGFAKRLAQL